MTSATNVSIWKADGITAESPQNILQQYMHTLTWLYIYIYIHIAINTWHQRLGEIFESFGEISSCSSIARLNPNRYHATSIYISHENILNISFYIFYNICYPGKFQWNIPEYSILFRSFQYISLLLSRDLFEISEVFVGQVTLRNFAATWQESAGSPEISAMSFAKRSLAAGSNHGLWWSLQIPPGND